VFRKSYAVCQQVTLLRRRVELIRIHANNPTYVSNATLDQHAPRKKRPTVHRNNRQPRFVRLLYTNCNRSVCMNCTCMIWRTRLKPRRPFPRTMPARNNNERVRFQLSVHDDTVQVQPFAYIYVREQPSAYTYVQVLSSACISVDVPYRLKDVLTLWSKKQNIAVSDTCAHVHVCMSAMLLMMRTETVR
jgi:hypothetical protein